MKKSVLVVGATGMLGKPVAEELNKRGFNVRILSRNSEKAKSLFGDSFDFAEGDIGDPISIQKALVDCYGVHINLSGEAEFAGTQAVVRAARKGSVKRISYISGATVSKENSWFPMIDRKYKAEQAIVESGISWCIFRSSWFMEAFSKFVTPKKAMMIGKQPKPWHFIAVADYARMVANSYEIEEAANKYFYSYGPEAYKMHEVLQKYIGVLHPGIEKISTFPVGFLKVMASLTGKKILKETVGMMHYFEKVNEPQKQTETYELLGKPEICLDDWLQMKKKSIEIHQSPKIQGSSFKFQLIIETRMVNFFLYLFCHF